MLLEEGGNEYVDKTDKAKGEGVWQMLSWLTKGKGRSVKCSIFG